MSRRCDIAYSAAAPWSVRRSGFFDGLQGWTLSLALDQAYYVSIDRSSLECYVLAWSAMRTKSADGRRTFTELARRAQIAQCAAEAITEVGYADASMAEIARRAGVAKSVVSYHFSDKAELMGEVLRTALVTYAKFMEPRMALATSVSDKLRAYLVGTADYVAEHRSLHVAVIEIAFNATSADGRPLKRLSD
jgi:hypothetical protein